MHHYGEDAMKVELDDSAFRIELQNHVSGAVITISGPREGVFQDSDKVMERNDAYELASEVAHLMRRVTGEAEMTMGA
jgi:hypothetical protein